MKTIKNTITTALALVFMLTSMSISAQSTDAEVTVIELTQVVGEFKTTELNLRPGKYQFRVVNENVEKEVGFVIQKADEKDMDFMKTAVDNSFTSATVSKGRAEYTGVVDLKQGDYVYSCPLNPTPHYTISVK